MKIKSTKHYWVSEDLIPDANSSTVIMRADSSPNFRNYSIREDAMLFINTDTPYEAGKLSMFRKGNGFKLMPDKELGYEYVGRLISAINYYF